MGKIKYEGGNNLRNWNDWIFIKLMTFREKAGGDNSHLPETREMDVKIVADGVEIDFLEFFGFLEKQYDAEVAKEAQRLLAFKVEPLQDKLHELSSCLDRMGKDLFPGDYEGD